MEKKPAQTSIRATTMARSDWISVRAMARAKTSDPSTMVPPLPMRLLSWPAMGPVKIPMR